MTTYTWSNNSGSYSDSSQWTDDQDNNPSGPPGAGDTAEMAGGDITGSGAAEELDLGGTMTFDATLTVTNLISNGDVTINSQTITAETASMNGTLDLLGELDVTGYAAGMYGTLDLTIENGGKLSVTKLQLLDGSTLEVDKGGEIDASGGQNVVPANGPVGAVINGTASIDGGTIDSSGGWISVGDFGDGRLDANSGATITSTYGSIGSFSGDTGIVTLEGAGTVWQLNGAGRGYIGIGSGGSPGPAGGSGSLTVSDGANLLASTSGDVADFSGSTGEALVTGSGSLASFGTFLVVGDQGDGTFNVTDQGKVMIGTDAVVSNQSGSTGDITLDTGATVTITDTLYIGNNADTDGKVSVDGDGTTLTAGNGIEVGTFGTGSLEASNDAIITINSTGGFGFYVGYGNGSKGTFDLGSGAQLTDDAFADVGTLAGSKGTVTIDGTDTLWHQDSSITVGYGGSGSVTIQNEAAVEADALNSGIQGSSFGDTLSIETAATLTVNSAILSLADGSDMQARVDGSGSLWTIDGNLTVGDGGDAVLSILNQGEVDAGSVTIAGEATSKVNGIGVDGDGSLLDIDGEMDVGSFGEGLVNITDGGVVDADIVVAGLIAGSEGDLTVDGDGSMLVVTQDLDIGLYGSASVTISDGSEIDDAAAYLGELGDAADGEATVEDDGSVWHTTNGLVVGDTGFGSLLVASGGEVDADSLTIGGGASSGTAEDPDFVTVTGDGSLLQIASSLFVGFDGFGALYLGDDAQLAFSGDTISLGVDAGSGGYLTISNSDLTFSGQLLVGEGGDGVVDVQDSAAVEVGALDIAEQSTSGSEDDPSIVTVSGAGSALTVDYDLDVGVAGYGTLAITDGATLSYFGDQLVVGDQLDGVGEFDVTGAGESLTLDTTLIVGNAGTGVVHVLDGATFENDGELTVGSQDGSIGVIEVSGDGSTWTTGGSDTTFGDAGDGTLDVEDGGTFDASLSSVTFASQESGTGSLTITGDCSSVTADALTFGDSGTATGSIEDGGALSVNGDLSLGDGEGGSGDLTVADGDLTVGGNLTLGGAGTGVLVSQGGSITVQGSEISIGDEASGTGTFTINSSDASLDFSGEIKVGSSGNGAMFVQLGASITVDAITVADQTGSTGSLTVDSASTMLQTGDLTVGSSGQATLDVKNGAELISTGEGKIADLVAGVISNATVESGGLWALNGDLTVGGSGIGTLNVDDATVSTLSSVTIGDLEAGSGFITVTGIVAGTPSGPASLGWGDTLTVGNDGDGTLMVEDGALVESIPGGSGEVDIAAHDGSTGSVTVDGVNSRLDATNLAVGGSLTSQGGAGTLTAQNGGEVDVSGALTLWNGTVDVADGGLLVIGTAPASGGPADPDSTVIVRSDGNMTGDGTITGDVIDDGAIEARGGTLSIDGSVSGSGVVEIGAGATADITGSVAAATAVDFLSNTATLVLDQPSDFQATIDGLQHGDTIDLAGVKFSDAVSAQLLDHNILEIVTAGDANTTYDFQLDPTQDFAGEYFHLSAFQGGSGTAITENSTPCYCLGTLILTGSGHEIPVERLAIGDHVATLSGVARPIKWIGRRSYGGRFVMGRTDILPVCIKAGSIENGVPRRDLWISPHHAMYLDGVLIEARDLVNGVSILQAEHVDTVDYFHIELETHDVIIAEGAWSETFVDDDSRGMFHNAQEYSTLYPERQTWAAALYCAPRLKDGYEVETARRRLAARTGLGCQPDKPGIGTLRGYIDLISPRHIAGWAQNSDHPEAPVCLDIFAGGRLIGRALANRYRDDLARGGLGSGRHGFEFVPPGNCNVMSSTIEVRRSLDGLALKYDCRSQVPALSA